ADSKRNIRTLANFGSVGFSNAKAVINGVSGAINSRSWQSQGVNLTSSGSSSRTRLLPANQQDTTSALSNSGSSFVVIYNPTSVPNVSATRGTRAPAAGGLGATAGAPSSLAKPVKGPVLTQPAALAGGYAPSGMIHFPRSRPHGGVAGK